MSNPSSIYHDQTDFSKEREFTISVFTENNIGLLNHITVVFTRRNMNINSLTTSESEIEGIYRFTITITTTREQVEKLVKQLEKIVDVIKAFVHEEEEVVTREIALYKLATTAAENGLDVEMILKENNARILYEEKDFFIIEKTGDHRETQKLFAKLEPHGLLEFARSGRVAVMRSTNNLDAFLKEIEAGES